MAFSDYVVYVDESGDHSLDVINPDWPLFVLCFCIFPVEAYAAAVAPAIRQLKFEMFGHDLVILHEHDIRKKRGAFSLFNQPARESFMERLTDIIANADMTIVAVVVDKVRLKERYQTPFHPYHLAMQFGLERIDQFLRLQGQGDRETCVVFEARGAKEDRELELEFRRVCDGSNRDRRPLPLRIHVADKKTNSEGLQLADLTARPLGLSLLRPDQSNRAAAILRDKLFRGARDCVIGNGLKVFP
ncbi:DUF3800 domain-containing protein [uncultured Luteimonas sp.]|uniref:DUF3800 domain-containing protein n=1 Tax=uncultured Luteimonas sp. TaxID=453144 RepID=UPI00262DB043|nr:DUF3800 domain-containing protein [uncultured Luteimonas sp.]